MSKIIAAALFCALAPASAFAAVSISEPPDLSGTISAANTFAIGVGTNTFSGNQGSGTCTPTPNGFGCDADIGDAFKVELAVGHRITSAVATDGFRFFLEDFSEIAISDLIGQIGQKAFVFSISGFSPCDTSQGICQKEGRDWSVGIEVSQVPLPAAGLLLLGGLAALGGAARRRGRRDA